MVQQRYTVLLIDDSPEDRELYRRYLLQDLEHSYTIIEASLGHQGIELWRQHQPDVAILDYHLPDLDGLEFLSQLESPTQERCLPVIFVTGQGNESIAVQAIKAGAQDYLVKGQMTPEGLLLAISGAIETVRLRTQLQQRIERSRLVAQITQKVQQTLDLGEILQTTVDEVRQFLHTDRVLVFQLASDCKGSVVAESVGAEWRSLLLSNFDNFCLAEACAPQSSESLSTDRDWAGGSIDRYRQGHVTAIADIHSVGVDPRHIQLLEPFQVKANLVVPILSDGQCWGLLIAHHCAAVRSWQPLEIELLQELASSVSIALRQALLYQQAQHELAERQYTEAELRESEKRYATLARISPVGIFRADSAGNCQYVNARWRELAGLSFEEARGTGWIKAIHPDDRDRVVAEWYEAATQNLPIQSEYRFQTSTGAVSWLMGQTTAEKDADGTVIGYVGTITDISDRKQTEQALQANEERFRQMAENIDAVFWIKEVNEARVSYVSPAYERLWGLNPQDLYDEQQAWINHIHPDDQDAAASAFESKAAMGLFDEEYRLVLPTGQVRWVRDRCFPLKDEAGTLYRYTGITEDITDRKLAERALRESEERFRTSVENMLDCFAIYRAVRSQQGQIVDFQAAYINDAACLVSQIPREQHLEKTLCELLPSHRESGLFDEYCQVVETGQSLVKDSLMYEDSFGQQRLSKAFDIRVAKFGDGYIATWRDITERKQTEEALRKSEEQLRLALAGAQAGSWDWDIATGNVNWSPENYDLYGVEAANGLNWYYLWYTTIHPDDRERVRADILRFLEQRLLEFKLEFRIVHPQRGERWLLGLGRSTFNAQGEPIRLSGINIDITDRKKTEESLRQSEEFKRRILDSSSDCIKLLDLNGRLLYMNTGGLCLLEIDDFTPYLHADWARLWQDGERSHIEEAIATAKAGDLARFQGFSPTAKGNPKWWDVVVTPILDTAGNVSQLLATSRDITDRRQSEEALKASEERFRTLADNMSQFAWMADKDGHIFWYNQRWLDYTGSTLEDMQGWGWQSVHHPDHVDRVLQYIHHCFETGQLWEDTFPLRAKDGHYRWFLSRATPIKDENGAIVCWFGTNTDINDRKQVEEALRQSEERYRCLAELIPQLVWTTDAEGSLLDVNQRWLDFTGITLQQAHEGGWAQIVHPDDVPILAQQWAEAVRQGIHYQAEGRMRRVDGVYCWHLHQAIPQLDEQGHIVKWFGTATEIEAQKQMEAERDRLLAQEQAARAEAERANRIKDEFLAVLSHELRSPLNPILGWTKLLQTRRLDPAKTDSALATIERNAKLQTQLIDDLLDVAKILRGKLSMETVPVDLTLVVESAIDTVKTAALAKSIVIYPDLPPIGRVLGDSARLQQVVWNLLSNAVKFTPNQGRVDIQLARVGNQAQITVSDTGKGINPNFLPYIFESFQQEDASTTRKYGGLGLGLAIVRSLVEAHGGQISVASRGEDQGATFTIKLPLLDVALEPRPQQAMTVPNLDLTGLRVLAVDDEPDARDLLTALLMQYGAEVLTVTSATEVLENLGSFQPDVLVSDIGMPTIDGYSLIQQVRALTLDQGGQIPAIALTAYAREVDYQRALASGYQRHITKPLEPEILAQAIASLVAK